MSTKKNDGGPAFPHQFQDAMGHPEWRQSTGMTKREWYAGQALAGLLASMNSSAESSEHFLHSNGPKAAARWAFAFADAMIEAGGK